MSFWALKTGVYNNDVLVVNYASLTILLDSIQASKIGDVGNVEELTHLLVTKLGLQSAILNKLTIVSNVGSDSVLLTYSNLRYPWERLAFLQHVRLITKNLSDDPTILLEIGNQTIGSTAKLVYNVADPIVQSGSNLDLQFDVIAGYPNEAGGGLTIYEQMFKEHLAFMTNGGIDISQFGLGSDGEHITASFDVPAAPTLYKVRFDLNAASAARTEQFYQIAALCESGIANTYVELKTAGAVLAV